MSAGCTGIVNVRWSSPDKTTANGPISYYIVQGYSENQILLIDVNFMETIAFFG